MQRPEPVGDLAWSIDDARAFGDAALELWIDYLARLQDRPIAGGSSVASVRAALLCDVPAGPLPREAVFEHLRTLAFEQSTATGHPGFVAYISGAGTVPGAAADLIAAALNQKRRRLAPLARRDRDRVALMRWFAGRLGLPDGAGGLITSGGAMAAFTALKAARDAVLGTAVRRSGVAGAAPVALYASTEVHDVNLRAADMLGLGSDCVRRVPTDGHSRMDVAALRAAVARDAEAGVRPLAIIATAGTVATGAIDPLDAIADVCSETGAWLHVDGAYGAIAAMVDALRPAFHGIARADSVVFDPHKWLYTPHSGGAVLVRDARRLYDAFHLHPSYTYDDPERSGAGSNLYDFGPSFSRGFHALKIWVSLLAHGWAAYERRIAHDIELARWLHHLAGRHAELEAPLPEPTLSIACFRFVPRDLRAAAAAPGTAAYLDRLNERLMIALQASGRVFPSNAVVEGRFLIRACIVNFRTEAGDIEALVELAAREGRAGCGDAAGTAGPASGRALKGAGTPRDSRRGRCGRRQAAAAVRAARPTRARPPLRRPAPARTMRRPARG